MFTHEFISRSLFFYQFLSRLYQGVGVYYRNNLNDSKKFVFFFFRINTCIRGSKGTRAYSSLSSSRFKNRGGTVLKYWELERNHNTNQSQSQQQQKLVDCFHKEFHKHIKRLAKDSVNIHNIIMVVERTFFKALFSYI